MSTTEQKKRKLNLDKRWTESLDELLDNVRKCHKDDTPEIKCMTLLDYKFLALLKRIQLRDYNIPILKLVSFIVKHIEEDEDGILGKWNHSTNDELLEEMDTLLREYGDMAMQVWRECGMISTTLTSDKIYALIDLCEQRDNMLNTSWPHTVYDDKAATLKELTDEQEIEACRAWLKDNDTDCWSEEERAEFDKCYKNTKEKIKKISAEIFPLFGQFDSFVRLTSFVNHFS